MKFEYGMQSSRRGGSDEAKKNSIARQMDAISSPSVDLLSRIIVQIVAVSQNQEMAI